MYYFIVNPSSRSGHGKEVWQTVEEILDQEDVEYRVYFTAHRYHATKLAQEITAQNTRLTLVAIGGDGTVNEILNGIRDFSTVTFAYIPTGSGNDFARALGLPSDTAEAVNNILHPSYFGRADAIFRRELRLRFRCRHLSRSFFLSRKKCIEPYSPR